MTQFSVIFAFALYSILQLICLSNGAEDDVIYRNCNHKSQFTEKEIAIAKNYIQDHFKRAPIPPLRPACNNIIVRRDFKCLTHNERLEFINAYLEVYKTGLIDTLTEQHWKYWGAAHKTSEGIPFHRMMYLRLEQAIMKVNPNVTLPYWDNSIEFAAPEKSIIFDYFGHAGNASNDYCVPDGPLKGLIFKTPEPHCLRREWNTDGTIPRYDPPEWLSATLNSLETRPDLFGLAFFEQHFKKHLALGGYHGDMSIPSAPNDPLFYLYHNYQTELYMFKASLFDYSILTAKFTGSQSNGRYYDYNTKTMMNVSTTKQTLHYFTNTTIIEGEQFGYGELCYLTDTIIEAILNTVNNVKPVIPEAILRLKSVLPESEFKEYFPLFAANNETKFYFTFDLINVGKRNENNKNCSSLPYTELYNSTANGRRQYERFRTDIEYDISGAADESERDERKFITTMNKYKYCSPYV